MIRLGVKNPIVTERELSYFATIPKNILIRPLVSDLLEEGKLNVQQIANKFGTTHRVVDRIKNKKRETDESDSL